jgi:hypothetical protein
MRASAHGVRPAWQCRPGGLLTNFFVVAVVMMVIGPLAGAGGGAVGGFVAADHPRRSRPARSRAAGLFARF